MFKEITSRLSQSPSIPGVGAGGKRASLPISFSTAEKSVSGLKP